MILHSISVYLHNSFHRLEFSLTLRQTFLIPHEFLLWVIRHYSAVSIYFLCFPFKPYRFSRLSYSIFDFITKKPINVLLRWPIILQHFWLPIDLFLWNLPRNLIFDIFFLNISKIEDSRKYILRLFHLFSFDAISLRLFANSIFPLAHFCLKHNLLLAFTLLNSILFEFYSY